MRRRFRSAAASPVPPPQPAAGGARRGARRPRLLPRLSSSASTATSPSCTPTCSRGRSASSSSAASSSSGCSACTATGCGTRRSATTSRSRRPASSRRCRSLAYVAIVQPRLRVRRHGRFIAGQRPGRRARALRAADARLHRRLALPRPLALRAPAARLPRAARRALGAHRRRRRRRPAAAARDHAQPRPRLPAGRASSTTTRASRARGSTAGCSCSGTTADLPRVLDDVEPDEVLIAIPSAPGTMRARVVAACRERGVPVRTMPTVFELLQTGGRLCARSARSRSRTSSAASPCAWTSTASAAT